MPDFADSHGSPYPWGGGNGRGLGGGKEDQWENCSFNVKESKEKHTRHWICRLGVLVEAMQLVHRLLLSYMSYI